MTDVSLGKELQDVRVEKDLLGTRTLPAQAYYGINSLRASENYTVSGYSLHPELIVGLAMVKKAAAMANLRAGQLEPDKAQAIAKAADEIIEGKLHDQFIGQAIQGGAGTGINMNANEVIANRALEILGHRPGDYQIIHPLDHVNKGQSTNDVVPTAIRIAAIRMFDGYVKAAQTLVDALEEKASEYAAVPKLGRTHLQDAVPITIGQELEAWACAISRDVQRGQRAIDLLSVVNLGGTAIGTSLNADPVYVDCVVDELRKCSGIDSLRPASNRVDATQNLDILVEVSGLLKASATTLTKIANDLRLMASGPMAGLAEVRLPAIAAGSSIMPGKVNPVIPEMVNQVCFRVYGNDSTISLAASAGQFELNVMQPVLSFSLFESIGMLTEAMTALALKVVKGMEFNTERCEKYASSSLSLVTALAPIIGHSRAAEVSKKAMETGQDILSVVTKSGILDENTAKTLLDPRHMLNVASSD
ncbi:MAG: aspartate ammonia-lyase [Firmicutes bacterium]|jgi:aspartate ammonia-lyase|nr:aspartate ammonia-lyase [Candidatus Fermentithermobacillaceae bacterium]